MANKNLTNLTKIILFVMLSVFCNELTVEDVPQAMSCDFLSVYATTPEVIASKVHFEKCEITNRQVAWVTAIYRVDVQDVMEVERYFANKYGFPPMKWIYDICYEGLCIMSNAGYLGLPFKPEKVNILPDDWHIGFKMKGYYDMLKVPNNQTFNRKYIKNFTIEISIAQNP